MKTSLLHNDFQWNASSFTSERELIDFVDVSHPELSDFIREWFGESGIIYIKTSGSTGLPKLIGLKRSHMINSARSAGEYFDLPNRSRALLCLPLTYVAGRMMLVRAMVLGWHLDVISAESEPNLNPEKQYDFSAMVPLQLYNSIKRITNIKTLIVGGGKVSSALLEKVKAVDTRIFATYGMTETITHIAVSPLNKAAGLNGNDLSYQALANVTFSIDNRQCLVIEAKHVSDEIIITNDVVTLFSKTSFEWLARFDNVINSGGLKFFPEQIEKKLEALVEKPFFISGLKDKALGERMVLFVEGDKIQSLLINLKEYQKKYPERLSKKEIPREIYFVKSFQRTETNKINRKATLKSYFDAS